MWTPEHRRAANRSSLRYPSDLTDAEWEIVGPPIPPASAAKTGRRSGAACAQFVLQPTRGADLALTFRHRFGDPEHQQNLESDVLLHKRFAPVASRMQQQFT